MLLLRDLKEVFYFGLAPILQIIFFLQSIPIFIYIFQVLFNLPSLHFQTIFCQVKFYLHLDQLVFPSFFLN